MSRRRLHLPAEITAGQAPGQTVRVEGERAHYLGRVLRLSPGQALLIFDGQGGEREASVAGAGAGWVELALGPPVSAGVVEESPLTLLLAVAKGDVPDRVVRAVTELGVQRIVPVITRRGVVALEGQRAEQRVARWQRIAAEAARQCGRSRIPELGPVTALTAVLAEGTRCRSEGGVALLVYEGEQRRPLRASLAGPPARVVALVGPEGGFAPEEVEQALGHGFEAVGLGRAVLRAETAATTVVALVAEAFGLLG